MKRKTKPRKKSRFENLAEQLTVQVNFLEGQNAHLMRVIDALQALEEARKVPACHPPGAGRPACRRKQ